jgi:cholesterol transport system auxiliary component
MTMITSLLRLALAALVLSLTACAGRPPQPALFDFGPLPAAQAPAVKMAIPAIVVSDIEAPAWLDGQAMFYRLAYANRQQPRPYAGSRWTMPPSALLAQRLKTRIAQAGGMVASSADGAANLPVLRIEVDDFMQSFSAPAQSEAQVALRASLFNGRALVAQQSFSRRVPSASADAEGGAAALAAASDALIGDVIAWLAQARTAMR